MLVIEAGGNFIAKGALIPEPKELAVLTHALVVERERVTEGQTNYGPMTIEELDTFIAQMQAFKENPSRK